MSVHAVKLGFKGTASMLKLISLLMGGRHSTAVGFTLHAQPAQVRITAPENFSDVAVLIDSKDSAEKA